MRDYILAIETGGTKIQMALGLPTGEILYNYRTLVEPSKGALGILDTVLSAIPHLKEEASKREGIIRKISIGFGGPVESKTGVVYKSLQIDGWDKFPLKQYMEEKTGLPTAVHNDTDTACWGEYVKGCGDNSKVFFYTNIGSGVGGGLVLDGELYKGQGYSSIEFGQTRVVNPWGSDRFSNETVENLCSGWSIEKRLRNTDVPKDSLLWELCSFDLQKLNCKMLGEAVVRGDTFATEMLDDVAHLLALGLSNVINLTSPQVLAIGGGVSLIGEPLIGRINKYVPKLLFHSNEGNYRIVQCELGEDIVLVGALLLADKD